MDRRAARRKHSQAPRQASNQLSTPSASGSTTQGKTVGGFWWQAGGFVPTEGETGATRQRRAIGGHSESTPQIGLRPAFIYLPN